MMKKIAIFGFFFSFITCFTQNNHKIDSLKALLNSRTSLDTNLVLSYHDVGYAYSRINPDSSKVYAIKGLALSQKLQYKHGLAMCYNLFGMHYHMRGEYDKALKYYEITKRIRTQIGDKRGTASAQNNAGIIYYMQGKYEKALALYASSEKLLKSIRDSTALGNTYNYIASVYYYTADYNKALKYFSASLAFSEMIKDEAGIAQARNNLGNIYGALENQEKAEENYLVALKISKSNGDKYLMASVYNNLGSVSMRKHDSVKAYAYYTESLKISKELNQKQGIAYNLINIGGIHEAAKEYKKALEFFIEGYKVHEEIGEKRGMANALKMMATCYIELKQTDHAEIALNKALKISTEIKAIDLTADCFKIRSALFRLNGNFPHALIYLKKHRELRDSILNDSKNKDMAEMQTRFDSDKKEREIVILTKNKNIEELEMKRQKADIKKQNIVIYTSVIGFVFALILVVFVLRSYVEKRKANMALSEKNLAISEQKKVIEDKNKLINESITYAKNIQEAILPSQLEVQKHFPNSFILFKPKDVVSGDFFWVNNLDGDIYLAAVDCVGHGVPGAFMAVHSYSQLENILKGKRQLSCGTILDQLQSNIIKTLNHGDNDESVKHGMDLSMIRIQNHEGDKNEMVAVEYSGAHNALIVVDDVLREIKADRMYIGGAKGNFTNHNVKVKKGSMLYLFTDGYADQKGGTAGKKFYSQSMRDTFIKVSRLELAEQKKILEKTHLDWRNNREQIDDILIIGIRV